MANANFIVQNGISIGGSSGATITADPTTGAVAIAPAATAAVPNPTATVFTTTGTTTTVSTVGGVPSVASIATAANAAVGLSVLASGGSNVTVNSGNITFGLGNANVGAFVPSTTNSAFGGNLVMNGSIVPSANVAYALGSRAMMWKDLYVGPGTLYINGKAVLSDNSGTITFTTDPNQNLSIQTAGTGDIQINPTGTGSIALQNTIKVTAGKNFTSSDGNAIGFANQIAVDSISSKSSNTDLTLSALGSGKVNINDDCTITGNLYISGSTTTINTTNLSVADNIIDLNGTVTSGTPVLDAGIRVLRGDSAAVQIRWTEASKAWQLSNDGSIYSNIATQSYVSGAISAATPSASTLTGTTLASGITASSLTSVGTLTGLTVSATITGSVSGSSGNSPAGSLTGSTLASGVTASSLTSVGTLTGLTVSGALNSNGQLNTAASIIPTNNNTQNIGSASFTYATVYATTFSGVSTTAKYADLAENYQADRAYAPGTVLMFGGSAEVTMADQDTTAVAGIVSTNPAHLMNGGLTGANIVPLALQGRVPCNVIGPVRKGDLMVSAGHGYAKANNSAGVGQVIGKALQEVTFPGKAVIEVVVGRV